MACRVLYILSSMSAQGDLIQSLPSVQSQVPLYSSRHSFFFFFLREIKDFLFIYNVNFNYSNNNNCNVYNHPLFVKLVLRPRRVV